MTSKNYDFGTYNNIFHVSTNSTFKSYFTLSLTTKTRNLMFFSTQSHIYINIHKGLIICLASIQRYFIDSQLYSDRNEGVETCQYYSLSGAHGCDGVRRS